MSFNLTDNPNPRLTSTMNIGGPARRSQGSRRSAPPAHPSLIRKPMPADSPFRLGGGHDPRTERVYRNNAHQVAHDFVAPISVPTHNPNSPVHGSVASPTHATHGPASPAS